MGTEADIKNNNVKSSKKKFIKTILIIVLIIIPVVWIVDWIIVESSPVGRYYHYTYQIEINPGIDGYYTILLPIIVLENGEVADFMEELIDLGYEIENSQYGEVLNITDNSEVQTSAHGEYDAIKESSDYRTDFNPTFSTWYDIISPENHSYSDLSGSIWIYCSDDNIELFIMYSSRYKFWHVNEGIIHNGYKRGGGGYSLRGSGDSIKGWYLFNITSWDIEVE